jgi:hypothetical protein
MNPTEQRTIRARRNLRALFGLGFFITFLGTASSGLFLYLFWTRAPKAMVPAWQAWQYAFIQASLTFVILLAICVINTRLIKRLTDDTND